MGNRIGIVGKENIRAFELFLPENYIAKKDAKYIGVVDEEELPQGVLCYTASVDVIDVLFIGAIDIDKRIEYGRLMLDYIETLMQESYFSSRIEIIWTQAEDAFYRELLADSRDFEILEDGECYVLTPEARNSSEVYQRLKEQKSSVCKYRSLDEKDRQSIRHQLAEDDSIEFLEPTDGKYMKELSLCSYEKGELTAAIFFSRVIDGIELSFIYAKEKHSKNLAGVLAEAMRIVDEKYPNERIEFTAVNDKATGLVTDIFGDDLVAEKNYVAISFGRI